MEEGQCNVQEDATQGKENEKRHKEKWLINQW